MKLFTTTVNDARNLGCTVQSTPATLVDIPAACPLLPESVIYGVCRFLAKSPALRDTLIPISYYYRLPHKKARGQRRSANNRTFWLDIPCAYLSLAQGKVLANVTVAGDGITLNQVLVKEEAFRLTPFAWERVLTIKQGGDCCA